MAEISHSFESAWQNWGLTNSPSKIRHMLNLHLDLIGMHQLNEVEEIEDCLSSKPIRFSSQVDNKSTSNLNTETYTFLALVQKI